MRIETIEGAFETSLWVLLNNAHGNHWVIFIASALIAGGRKRVCSLGLGAAELAPPLVIQDQPSERLPISGIPLSRRRTTPQLSGPLSGRRYQMQHQRGQRDGVVAERC